MRLDPRKPMRSLQPTRIYKRLAQYKLTGSSKIKEIDLESEKSPRDLAVEARNGIAAIKLNEPNTDEVNTPNLKGSPQEKIRVLQIKEK